MGIDKVFESCPLIVGLGEILWDMLPDGKLLGGAPANFAYHCHALGADAKVLSAIGNDRLGREIIDELNARQVNIDYIDTNSHPTGTVDVLVGDYGDAHYTINEEVAWDHIQWTDELQILAARADAVCFGSLAQRSTDSCEAIHQFLSHTKADCLRIFDINLRQQYYSRDIIEKSLQAANVLKLNDDELVILREMLELPSATMRALCVIRDRYKLHYIALTSGANGSVLLDREDMCQCDGYPAIVVDTVGAGDSYTAVLTFGVLHKLPSREINRLANQVAAYVCSQAGATPRLPDSLIAEINRLY